MFECDIVFKKDGKVVVTEAEWFSIYRKGETKLLQDIADILGMGNDPDMLYRELADTYHRKIRMWNIQLTVDALILNNRNEILLVRRRNDPWKGYYALPGGFVEYGECVEDAVAREVQEETGLKVEAERLVSVQSKSDRDPRGHTVSAVFYCRIISGELKAGDDAESALFLSKNNLPQLAFDHKEIIEKGMALMGKPSPASKDH